MSREIEVASCISMSSSATTIIPFPGTDTCDDAGVFMFLDISARSSDTEYSKPAGRVFGQLTSAGLFLPSRDLSVHQQL